MFFSPPTNAQLVQGRSARPIRPNLPNPAHSLKTVAEPESQCSFGVGLLPVEVRSKEQVSGTEVAECLCGDSVEVDGISKSFVGECL